VGRGAGKGGKNKKNSTSSTSVNGVNGDGRGTGGVDWKNFKPNGEQ
jgi:hypothetical protein